MNYQEYLELRQELSRSLKFYSVSYHLPTLMALVQCALLLFRIDIHFDYINMFVLDSLFTFAYQRASIGNYVYAAVFYIAFAAIIISFIYTSAGVLFFEKKRPSYKTAMLIYGVDALLWLGTFGVVQFILHAVILILMYITYKKHKMLEAVERSLWG